MHYVELDLDVTDAIDALPILARFQSQLIAFTNDGPAGGNPNFRVRLLADDPAELNGPEGSVTRLLDTLYGSGDENREENRQYIASRGKLPAFVD